MSRACIPDPGPQSSPQRSHGSPLGRGTGDGTDVPCPPWALRCRELVPPLSTPARNTSTIALCSRSAAGRDRTGGRIDLATPEGLVGIDVADAGDQPLAQ